MTEEIRETKIFFTLPMKSQNLIYEFRVFWRHRKIVYLIWFLRGYNAYPIPTLPFMEKDSKQIFFVIMPKR